MLDFSDSSSGLVVLSFYLPLILSILSMICCFLFLFTYLKYEKLRINSGKIHFILGFCISFLTLHFLASIFYSVGNSSESSSSPHWCKTLGVITNLVIYNFLLLHLFVSHNLLCCIFYKHSNFNKRYPIYLLLSLGLSVAITAILGGFNEIGYGPLGFCWLTNEKVSQIIHIITVGVVFPWVMGIQIYVYSKEHFINPHSLAYYNEDNFTVNNRKMFIRINLGYMFVFTICWLPASVIYILDFIFKENDWNIYTLFWFDIIRGIAFVFLSASAFCMFLVRMNEPVIKKAFKKIISKMRNKAAQNQPTDQSQNLDSQEVKDKVSLSQDLLDVKDKETKSKYLKYIHPQQYEIILVIKTKSNDRDLFSIKKKKSMFLKSNTFSEKEKVEVKKNLLAKCFIGTVFLIRNDINNQEVTINTKTPWEDHYYNDLTCLKSKLGDIIRLIMKTDNRMDKILEIFEEDLLEDVNCINIASLVFANLKSLYHIDNIKFFDSFYPIENLKVLEGCDYDPFSLKEEISINNFISFNNLFYLKILSESRVQFLKDSFLKNLHDHLTKSKGNSFLAPLISLYNLAFTSVDSINLAIYENIIGQIPPSEIYALLILEGLNIIHKKFKNGNLISTEIFPINEYQMENVLKLKYKDKSLLMKVMKTDLKFLLTKDITNYQIHLIFSRNPQKAQFMKGSIDNQKSVNLPSDDIYSPNVNTRDYKLPPHKKNGFSFECFLEDYECRVAVHNYLNTFNFLSRGNLNVNTFETSGLGTHATKYGTESNINLNHGGNQNPLRKLHTGDNFSVVNPDVYAKNFMDALQDLL